MASTSEYEQQQFWEDQPIEVILGDNSDWFMESYRYIFLNEKDIQLTSNFNLTNEK
jgi:hypothetical protein